MTGNYSTREFREKLYDDLHVRLSNILILMCSIFIASIIIRDELLVTFRALLGLARFLRTIRIIRDRKSVV